MSDWRGTPGEGPSVTQSGGAALPDVAARRRPSADPEALRIAIGARCEALEAAAGTQTPAHAPDRPDTSGQGRAGRYTTRWRHAAALAGVLLLAAVAGAGVYWTVPRLALGPPQASEPLATAAPDALTRAERRRVERLLKRLDFRVGAVDGRIDARTRAALRRYRRYQGMVAPHGRVTPALLADLRAVAALADGAGEASAP